MTEEETDVDLTKMKKLCSALLNADGWPEEQLRILEAIAREARRLLPTIPDGKSGGP